MRHGSLNALSFGTAARQYDRYRLGPSPLALDWMLPEGCSSVLDLGAGTGLVARQLVGRVQEVIAVEPDARMREVLIDNCPTATVLEGTAEQIPVPDSRVDAVLVSAAWHWMDPERALPEIARVLKPGGTFAVLYTRRDRRVGWVARLEEDVHRMLGPQNTIEQQIVQMWSGPWLPQGAPFTASEQHDVTWEVPLPVDELIGAYTTYSRFFTHPEQRRQELLGQIEERVRADAQCVGGILRMPMACYCWRMRAA